MTPFTWKEAVALALGMGMTVGLLLLTRQMATSHDDEVLAVDMRELAPVYKPPGYK